MLLKAYLHSLGIVGFGARSDSPHSLSVIGRFEISGTHYDVLMISGNRIEFPDLYALLACIQDEFKAAPTYDYELMVDRDTLLITPKNVMGRPWGRNVAKLIEDLTLLVSEYNLSGKWSSEVAKLPKPKPIWERF